MSVIKPATMYVKCDPRHHDKHMAYCMAYRGDVVPNDGMQAFMGYKMKIWGLPKDISWLVYVQGYVDEVAQVFVHIDHKFDHMYS